MRFRYCDKILLEVCSHKSASHIYKQQTYAYAHELIPMSVMLLRTNNNMHIQSSEFCVAYEHVTAWFTLEH